MHRYLTVFLALSSLFLASPGNAQITQTSESKCALHITQAIDSDLVSLIISLTKRTCHKTWKLEIFLASEGGHLNQAFALYEFLRSWPGGVTVHGSHVESAAVVIFLAGDTRTLDPSGRVLIHEPQMEIVEGSYAQKELLEMVKSLQLGQNLMARIISERTGLPHTEVTKMIEKSTLMDAKEAVRHGFASAVTAPPL